MNLSMHLKGDFIMSNISRNLVTKEFFFDVYYAILLTVEINCIPRNFRFKSYFNFFGVCILKVGLGIRFNYFDYKYKHSFIYSNIDLHINWVNIYQVPTMYQT